VPHDTRDQVVDFMNHYAQRTGLPQTRLVDWAGIGRSKFYQWRRRYGCANEHNGLVPRDFWLENWEKQAIVEFHGKHPLEGYRRLTFMMLDEDVVAVSPSSVYRVLGEAGLLRRWNGKASKKGTGFVQPLAAHEHWHVDIAYLNICGTFYYLCSLLDGYSRLLVHWEIREAMSEADVETIIQRAREQFPQAYPRIISDNGPQFMARDFKAFIRICGMTHVRTSPFYPQSNGKLERWFRSLKSSAIRPKTPLSLEDARHVVGNFVVYYNTIRLHSAIGYVTPLDKLLGREGQIFEARDRKLETARTQRRARRLGLTTNNEETTMVLAGETEAGSAGEQLARDNRPEVRRNVDAGTVDSGCPGTQTDIAEILPMPQKTHMSKTEGSS